MSPGEIGSFLMGVAALLTAIYAAWGGKKRDKTQEKLSFAEMEDELRTALFSDFKAQRDENTKLRTRIRELEERVKHLETELHEKTKARPKRKAR